MDNRKIDREMTDNFKNYLIEEERSAATITKYMRDIGTFLEYLGVESVNKEIVIAYKRRLKGLYAISSINSMLAAINCFFVYLGWHDCKVKQIKTQRRIFSDTQKELTRAEYDRILKAARDKKKDRINLVMQTICNTGIRISELSFITVEAVKRGQAQVNCKNKVRVIFICKELKTLLLKYIKDNHITEGQVFVTKNGKPIDRSNIWREMQQLCKHAGVSAGKVFPHNLRHLFACAYYKLKKDIAKLADILGHSNIETTRIYIMSSGKEHRRQMDSLRLVMV